MRSTTNSTVGVRLSGSERPAATLECSVEEGDGEVTVRWARDDRVLHNGAKYVIPSEAIREAAGVLVYLLTVRELMEDDLGAYECQLFSNFSGSSPEAVRTVWINNQGETLLSEPGAQSQSNVHPIKPDRFNFGHAYYIFRIPLLIA